MKVESSWETFLSSTFVSEYEARVEPFTGSFVEEMLQPFMDPASSVVAADEDCSKKKQPQLLLDVGCGSGSVTVFASEAGFRVSATDISPAMVDRVRQRHTEMYGQEGGSSNSNMCLEAVAVDGQELLPSWTDRFDYAVGAFSVIFFPDVAKGLREIHRCITPSTGRMVISAWGNAEETPAFQVFPDALRSVAPELPHKHSTPKRITGSPSILTKLLEEAGFVDVHIEGPITRTLHVASKEAFYNRFALTSPNTIATISKLSPDGVVALKRKVMELAEERGGGYEDGSIQIPSKAYFAYGTKPSSA